MAVSASAVNTVTEGAYTYQIYSKGAYLIAVEEKDHNGECDRCGVVTCLHKCHKELIGFSAFFWKVELFFWKLFKIQKTCICGTTHY